MNVSPENRGMTGVNGIGVGISNYTTDGSVCFTGPDDGSLSQDQTSEERSASSNNLYHHSRREESVLFTDIDKIRFTDVGLSENTNSIDIASGTEMDRRCQNYKGKGRNVYTHFASEWSSLLDKIEDSVEKVSKNYEGWRPETVGQQYGNSYWQYQTNGCSTSGYQTSGCSTSGYQTSGCSTSGYQSSGCSTSGYQSSGCSTSGYQSSGYSTSGYQTNGCSSSGYQTNGCSSSGTSKRYVSFMSEEQADKWASAPEFHPAFTSRTGRVKTYAEAVDPYAPRTRTKLATGVQFCPYYHVNRAELYLCPYLHGELCQICLNAILDFDDTQEKREHIKGCLREQEKRMKMSLAIQKSKGITCNICLEPVKEKSAGEARFGLLPNCNHCFCITCIRKWRQETRFTSQITRSCPICRVESPFVCPSTFWVETPEEKAAVITNYKKALRVKPCRLYNFGKGRCPFGDKCFYLHSLPDGTKPEQLDFRRPKRVNAEGLAQIQEYVLWDFIAMRDDPENYQPSLPPQYPQSLDSSSTESDASY